LSSLEAEQDEAALSLGRKIVFLMPLELWAACKVRVTSLNYFFPSHSFPSSSWFFADSTQRETQRERERERERERVFVCVIIFLCSNILDLSEFYCFPVFLNYLRNAYECLLLIVCLVNKVIRVFITLDS
jgi:uncharacterized protein YqhQ